GDYAHSATSGDSAHSATSGNSAHSATSGYSAHSSAKGKNAVAAALGKNSHARAAEGGAICLVAYDSDWNILAARASKVGDSGIKPNTWYKLSPTGDFIELDD